MKYLYYITICLIIIAMGIMSAMFYFGKTYGYLLPVTIVFINGITLIVILLDKITSLHKEEKSIPQIDNSSVIFQEEDTTRAEITHDVQNDDSKEWSIAMYKRFADRWQSIYDNVEYPTDKATKAEISVLAWEISSLTMDYLMLTNDSPNLLERHKESVSSVIKELKYQEMGLKQFYEDPSTIPAKVLAVYNTLSPQVAARQTFETNIFGYYVEIPKKQ